MGASVKDRPRQGRSHASHAERAELLAKARGDKSEVEAPTTASSDLSRLFTFAVWMLGDRTAGRERTAEVVCAAPGLGFVGWTQVLLAPLLRSRSAPRRRRICLYLIRPILASALCMDRCLASARTRPRQIPRRPELRSDVSGGRSAWAASGVLQIARARLDGRAAS